MAQHTASAIADWFIAWADAQDADVSNLKLQKLLYYAQGHFLGSTGAPLFTDDLRAWAHGPVIPSIYHRFKQYGGSPIDAEVAIPENFDWSEYQDVQQHLANIWATYGEYSAWALRNRTHREAPWRQAWDSDTAGAVIPRRSLQTFFEPLSGNG